MKATRYGHRVTESPDRLLSAVALRLTSVALFAAMNATIKIAEARGAALPEIMFFRQFGATLLVCVVVAGGPGFASLATWRIGAHLLRCAGGLTAMALTFASLLALPLAEATTLGFSMPIFATVLGALMLGESTGWRRWLAVLAGFVGVVIVARPGAGHVTPWGAVCGIAAAACTAGVSVLLRQIGRTERPLTTVFWFSTLSLAPLGAVYALHLRIHSPETWGVLLGIGLLGGAAQLAMTGSLARGPVSIVVPMDYSALLWATLLGWLLFGTLPGAATWLGAPIIIGSGLYIVSREHVRRRAETRAALGQGIG